MLIGETSPFVCVVCVLVAGTSPCNKSLRLVPSFVPTFTNVEVVLSSILEVHHSITNVTLCILITVGPPLASLPGVFSPYIPAREPVHRLNRSARCYQIVSLHLMRRLSLFSTLQLNLFFLP